MMEKTEIWYSEIMFLNEGSKRAKSLNCGGNNSFRSGARE